MFISSLYNTVCYSCFSRFILSFHFSNKYSEKHIMRPSALLICNENLFKVVMVEPAAGHLSSSHLYPTCRAPYLVLLACSDENVRFYECLRIIKSDGSISYKWKTWGMISNTMNSNIEMDGKDCLFSAFVNELLDIKNVYYRDRYFRSNIFDIGCS